MKPHAEALPGAARSAAPQCEQIHSILIRAPEITRSCVIFVGWPHAGQRRRLLVGFGGGIFRSSAIVARPLCAESEVHFVASVMTHLPDRLTRRSRPTHCIFRIDKHHYADTAPVPGSGAILPQAGESRRQHGRVSTSTVARRQTAESSSPSPSGG